MKTKSIKLISTLLAVALVLSLSIIAPVSANAEDDLFQVKEHPTGATYYLGDVAEELRATFVYDVPAQSASLDSNAPIVAKWYWSYENTNADRSNGLEESTVAYGRTILYTTTHVPATDEVGVKYYFAVISYAESLAGIGYIYSEPRETVTNPARIEVLAPDASEYEFEVYKVDEDGNPLEGAIIQVEGMTDSGEPVIIYARTNSDGLVIITVENGSYIISEYAAPEGYNPTGDTYSIVVTDNGIFYNYATHLAQYYPVVLVNYKIPGLITDDHFAYVQGYPDGTFGPSGNMTRAEAVVMFSHLQQESMDLATDYRDAYYPDIDVSSPWLGSNTVPWYANAVCFMESLHVLVDFTHGPDFRPGESVTRAEFATLAAHFSSLALTDVNIFSDVPDDHWAVKYINSAVAKGWINGYGDGTFHPEDFITRAEVVRLTNTILGRNADHAYIMANPGLLPRNYPDITVHWAYWDIMEASIGHDFDIISPGEEAWTAVYP